jgi:hypothetical protein
MVRIITDKIGASNAEFSLCGGGEKLRVGCKCLVGSFL